MKLDSQYYNVDKAGGNRLSLSLFATCVTIIICDSKLKLSKKNSNTIVVSVSQRTF